MRLNIVAKTKRGFSFICIIVAGVIYSGAAPACVSATSPDEAVQKMLDGNKRFMRDKQSQKDTGRSKKAELSGRQQPFAAVLSCSDSIVPPEHIFDQGPGDIFSIRVAGNIADKVELGSIEYAVEHLSVSLILVLGHESCSIVAAAIEGKRPEGNMDFILRKISPAVKKAKERVKDGDKLLDAALLENIKMNAMALTRKSAVIRSLVEKKKIRIVAGIYSLSTGEVKFIDINKAP